MNVMRKTSLGTPGAGITIGHSCLLEMIPFVVQKEKLRPKGLRKFCQGHTAVFRASFQRYIECDQTWKKKSLSYSLPPIFQVARDNGPTKQIVPRVLGD